MKRKPLLCGLMIFISIASKVSGEEKLLEEKDINLLLEALTKIEAYYYKERNMEECVRKILLGGIPRCTDLYSRYKSSETFKREAEEMKGYFFGIGVQLGQKEERGENYVMVMSVMPNSPAKQAGLRAGDFIVAVSSDGDKNHFTYTKKLPIEEVANLIRGKENSEVLIKIKRKNQYLDINLVRKSIKIEVVSNKLLKPRVGYIKISNFEGDLERDFELMASSLQAAGMEALVLDLRDNPGGLLDLAVNFSSFFTSADSTLILETRGRRPEEVGRWLANPLFSPRVGRFNKLKLVVLANEGSASASEIVTAYLKNDCGATIVGKKTFGKGIVQSLWPLADGGKLWLTSSEYFVGKNSVKVNDIGVSPDFEVDNPELKKGEAWTEDKDLQLKKALEVAEELLNKQ